MKTKPKILLGIYAPMVLLLILGAVSVYSINTTIIIIIIIITTNKQADHTYVVLWDG